MPVTRLHRSLLAVRGKDAHDFLNNLTSNSISNFSYTGFFSPPGRLLHDVFVYSPEQDVYLIDHHPSATAPISSLLKRYILRSKVKIVDVTNEYSVWATWDSSLENSKQAPPSSPEWQRDPRMRDMGWRSILPANDTCPQQQETSLVDESHYHVRRILLGVPEGPNDLVTGTSIPLESNLDYMGAIDFKKGCYVGQELTARTHHTGVTRKRIVPIRLFDPSEETPQSLLWPNDITDTEHLSPITSSTPSLPSPQTDIHVTVSSVSKPRPSGKICSTVWISPKSTSSPIAIGLGLVRLENLSGVLKAKADSEQGSKEWHIKGFTPTWWADRAKEHVHNKNV